MAAGSGGRFGLLGRRLGHSWSPTIHAALGLPSYELFEREPEELDDFLLLGGWQGLNVTIPYKRRAFELADEATPEARRLGVANTLVRRGGRILAHNTDLAGFAWMLRRFCLERLGGEPEGILGGREALVLGSGGASQAVQAALADAGAKAVVVSRTGEERYDGLAGRHPDAALVVNATPVGMYPDCPASPLNGGELGRMPGLRGVLDVVYNPLRTGICLAAERLGLPCVTGLPMLVGQALRSSELFQGRPIDEGLARAVEGEVMRASANVCLIGMPGAGKTTAGRALARLLERPFVDLDDALRIELGMSAAELISLRGEEAFREEETKVARSYGRRSGLVIACGGGIVTREQNYGLLHQNASIVLLERPLDQLSSAGRPLSGARGVEALARERDPLYRQWADLSIRCTGSAAGDARLVARLLGLLPPTAP